MNPFLPSRPASLLLVLAIAFSASSVKGEDSSEPITKTYVILKLDDVGGPSPQWKRTLGYLKEKNVKSAAGIVCNSLEADKPEYVAWVKEVQQTGLVEFWCHGYDHKQWKENNQDVWEFSGPNYEQQKDHLDRCQKLAKEKLGFAFKTFGAPFNKIDASTIKALGEDPEMKVILYGNTKDAATIPNILILDRTEMNIEAPIFVPNPKKMQHDYKAMAGTRDCFVIQGHPNMWNDEKFAEFQKLVEYLQSQGVLFTTPTEYLQTRPPGSLKVTVKSPATIVRTDASAAPAAAPALSENLLTNGDFENGAFKWSVFAPGDAQDKCAFETTPENPHSGSNSLMLSAPTKLRFAVLQYLKPADFTAGQRYRLSAWIRAGDDFIPALKTPGFVIRVSLFGPNFSNSGMFYLGPGGAGSDSTPLAGQEIPKTWTKIEGVFEMPQNVEKVNVCLFFDMASGHMYVDDISMERVEESTPLGTTASATK